MSLNFFRAFLGWIKNAESSTIKLEGENSAIILGSHYNYVVYLYIYCFLIFSKSNFYTTVVYFSQNMFLIKFTLHLHICTIVLKNCSYFNIWCRLCQVTSYISYQHISILLFDILYYHLEKM